MAARACGTMRRLLILAAGSLVLTAFGVATASCAAEALAAEPWAVARL